MDFTRYAQLADVRTLNDIPFFPQIEDQCGPASLATVLAAQGVDISSEQLRGKLYIPRKEGSITTEMIARARRYNMLAYVLEPELVDVLTEIDAGHPVLIMQNLGFSWFPKWHFSVVVGYDLNKKTISLRSGEKLEHHIDFSLFLKTWRRAGSWAMLAIPAGTLPATAEANRVIAVAHDLEQVGQSSAALSVYRSVIAQWPDTSIAYFGAGNSAYALGEFKTAHSFYGAYLGNKPMAVEGWNNMAYNLIQLGCGHQALQAIQCAVNLEPSNKQVLDSLNELSLLTVSSDKQSNCPEVKCPSE